MIYLYKCNTCNKEVTVSKSASDSSRVETCKCGTELKRVYTSNAIVTADGVKY